MFKRNYALIVAGILLLFLNVSLGCQELNFSKKKIKGSGNLVSENRSVSSISSVSLANQGNLFITIGSDEELVIETDDNLMEFIEVKIRSGELQIVTDKDVSIRPHDKLNYYLTVKSLNEISILSSGNVYAPELETEDFKVDINSSGDLKLDGLKTGKLVVNINSSGNMSLKKLRAKKIKVDINSSGDLNINTGGVESQQIAVNSSGNYNAANLASDEASVDINSSGDVNIHVRDFLDVVINSSGDVKYSGDPKISKRINSSGRIKQVGSTL
jgi:Putative auto-transporter adhesin, head GIN domain